MQSVNNGLESVVVSPDQRETVYLVGDTYTTLLSGEQTGGSFSLLEAIVSPETGPPPHKHNNEDETFILLSGEVNFRIGDEYRPVKAGTVVFVPKGTVHSFRNTGISNAKMLFMYSPAGMEKMFLELGKPGRRDTQAPPLTESDVAAMISVAAKYKFTIMP
jgi:mannose-6-phosphate isomerase-like protein (cupin superfamily)